MNLTLLLITQCETNWGTQGWKSWVWSLIPKSLHYPAKNTMLTPRQRLPWFGPQNRLQNSYGTRIARIELHDRSLKTNLFLVQYPYFSIYHIVAHIALCPSTLLRQVTMGVCKIAWTFGETWTTIPELCNSVMAKNQQKSLDQQNLNFLKSNVSDFFHQPGDLSKHEADQSSPVPPQMNRIGFAFLLKGWKNTHMRG